MDSLYIGQTKDVESRIGQHSSGWVESTRKDRPWELVAIQMVNNRKEARWLERSLKRSLGGRIHGMRTGVELIDPLVDKRWDRFVENHPFGWICHLSDWKRILEGSFKQMTGYYFAKVDKLGEEVKAGIPVFLIRSRLTGNRLVSIPFATLSDPLVLTSQDMEYLVKAVLELSRELKISYLEVGTFESPKEFLESFFGVHRVYRHHFLSLESSLDNLRKSFHQMTRRNINKAVKSGLRFRKGVEDRDLIEFYRLYAMNRRRKGLPPQPFLFIKKIFDYLCSSGRGTLAIVDYGGKPVASGLFFKFNGRFSNEFDAWDIKYKDLRANYLLYWEAIRLAHQEGYRIFDFGRTSANNKGLMGFKSRWGTKVKDLPHYYFPKERATEMAENEASAKYRFISKICRVCPNFVLPTLGKFIYRHMG